METDYNEIEHLPERNETLDCDMIILEMLAKQIVKDLTAILNSVDTYKLRLDFESMRFYIKKQKLISNIVFSDYSDEDHMTEIVSHFCLTEICILLC